MNSIINKSALLTCKRSQTSKKGPRMSKKMWPVVAILALSGCAMAEYKSKEDLPPLPSMAVIEDVATRAYGRPGPKDLKIVKVGQAEVIWPNDWDHYVCLTTTEPHTGTLLSNSGEVLRRPGEPKTQSWFMTFRLYNDGWGAGLFRRIYASGTRVGSRNASELCPIARI